MTLSSSKRAISVVSAFLLAFIYLVSGGWKVLQPFQTGELLEQAQVPAGLGTLGAMSLGTLELLAAALLILPAYRRWGALLGSALLVFFIGWIGFYYPKLVGHECSCFPIIKRSVGPGFFVTDALMLGLGLLAFAWSNKTSERVVSAWRIPGLAFLSLVVLAGVSFGVNAQGRSHADIPVPITVNGSPQNLSQGKVFLFFYDPMCTHCLAAAKFMSGFDWQGTRVIGAPTNVPQFAPDFLQDTKLKAPTALEVAKLREHFRFVDPPYGVALEDGHVRQTFAQAQFNAPSPQGDLRKLGFIR